MSRWGMCPRGSLCRIIKKWISKTIISREIPPGFICWIHSGSYLSSLASSCLSPPLLTPLPLYSCLLPPPHSLLPSSRLFGFVARKQGSTTDNVSHLFAELDPDQPASAIVSFVSKVMKRWDPSPMKTRRQPFRYFSFFKAFLLFFLFWGEDAIFSHLFNFHSIVFDHYFPPLLLSVDLFLMIYFEDVYLMSEGFGDVSRWRLRMCGMDL